MMAAETLTDKRYVGGPCKHCGNTIRLRCNRRCVACYRQRVAAQGKARREKRKALLPKPPVYTGPPVPLTATRFEGSPCKICGNTIRRSSGGCYACHRLRAQARLATQRRTPGTHLYKLAKAKLARRCVQRLIPGTKEHLSHKAHNKRWSRKQRKIVGSNCTSDGAPALRLVAILCEH